jgi:hypothetical protein
MHVPNGCPPPNKLSKSFTPTEVKWIPPVHGFTPLDEVRSGALDPDSDAVLAPRPTRLNDDILVHFGFHFLTTR